MIRDIAVFAPRKLDDFVFMLGMGANEAQILAERLFAANLETESRQTNQRAFVAFDAVIHGAVFQGKISFSPFVRRNDDFFESLTIQPFCPL